MSRRLFDAVAAGTAGISLAPFQDEPNPTAALKVATVKSLFRDLEQRTDLTHEQAELVVAMVMIGLKKVFDTPDLDLADRAAACLVAERVMLATLAGVQNAKAVKPRKDK